MLTIAGKDDLQQVIDLYHKVADTMEAGGLDQWHWGIYPRADILEEDVRLKRMWVEKENDRIVACVMIDTDVDEVYQSVNWLYGVRPGLFHRLAVLPGYQGQGLGNQVLDEVESILRARGCDSLRCDTNASNQRAIHVYENRGMRRCGQITWVGHAMVHDKRFFCFEKRLTRECPFLPQRMHPAFRDGKLTPWGGDKLGKIYGKPVSNEITGESLEVSCIPGLESTDDMGRPLPELISEFGTAFAGRYAAQPFPLLLKLIDARDKLSVQVHPDDDYAAENEKGKLGKTEAWLILDAPEDGELVYGIKPGTTLEELRTACEQGEMVEPLLRRVKVKPGDICYIPAGCVHAIGAGIMLYEIQQSSDLTYRFYDWNRTDAQGNRRELHLQKALDVTDLSFALDPVQSGASESNVERVLDETYFTLDLIRSDKESEIPAIHEVGLLTALEGNLRIEWRNGSLTLNPGDSLYLPTSCPYMKLKGKGKAALAMPD